MSSLACGYRNGSPDLLVLRCLGPDTVHLERVVFPFELLTFHCPSVSEVQIWRSSGTPGRRGRGGGGPPQEELVEVLSAEALRLEGEDEGPGLPLPGLLEAPAADLRRRYAEDPSEPIRRHLAAHERLAATWGRERIVRG
jgi:hypothetical protein